MSRININTSIITIPKITLILGIIPSDNKLIPIDNTKDNNKTVINQLICFFILIT